MATAPNLFTTAKTVVKKETAKKAKAAEVEIEGLEIYAAIDATEKALKALKETARTKVTETAREIFIANGAEKGGKPENFNGKEGQATASIQLRQRSSASGLSDIEIEQLTKAGIPTEVVEDRPETFIFNPEHLDWLNKNGKEISKALIKLGAPADVLLFQESTKKTVTTDESLKTLFTKPVKVIRELFDVVGTFAIRPSLKDEERAFELVRGIVGQDEE